MAASSDGSGLPFREAWEDVVATRASGAALLADAEAALAELATDVARRRAVNKPATTSLAASTDDHRAHPAVAALLAACPVPGLAAYVGSSPGPLPRPHPGAGRLADRLSGVAAGLAAGADAAERAAAAAADLARRPADELIAAAARSCPGIQWGDGGPADADAAPAVVALVSAAAAQASTLRSRVAAALADPALLLLAGTDPAPVGTYGLLWGLAPFCDEGAAAAVVALEAALVEEGGGGGGGGDGGD